MLTAATLCYSMLFFAISSILLTQEHKKLTYSRTKINSISMKKEGRKSLFAIQVLHNFFLFFIFFKCISNQIKSSLFSHTYNKQYVHFIKSDVTEEIL